MQPIAIVIVTHNSADALRDTLGGLEPQLGPGDEVVVVDNASSDGSAEVARSALPAATVLETGGNLGFAAGCHAGVRATSASLVLFLNPDCTPAPGCLDALRACAEDHPDWAAWQALVALPGGERVNTAGNVVHYLGFAWAGALDQPVASVPVEPFSAAFASGAALAVRRAAWDATGGFDERYFMYCEDLDLCLRLRLAGWDIGVAPAARVEHEYTFTKGDYKWFYLERNRWWTILGTYPTALLALLAPALLAFELVLLLAAAHGGWLRPKVRAQATVLRELPAILRRRSEIQASRRIGAGTFADTLVSHLNSPMLAAGTRIPGALALTELYWRLVRAILR